MQQSNLEPIAALLRGDTDAFIASAFREPDRCYGLRVIRPGFPCAGCPDCATSPAQNTAPTGKETE